MKLYKEQCSIDATHQFFSNRIVDIWNSLPQQSSFATVLLFLKTFFLFTENTVDIDRIQICKRNLTELTFSSFNYVNLKNMPLYLFIIGLASLHVMYYTTT